MSMDKVRISNAIGTSENEYPAPVAISVNGVAWGPAIAPQVDTKKLTIGDASGYKSEIAQALTEGWGQKRRRLSSCLTAPPRSVRTRTCHNHR